MYTFKFQHTNYTRVWKALVPYLDLLVVWLRPAVGHPGAGLVGVESSTQLAEESSDRHNKADT